MRRPALSCFTSSGVGVVVGVTEEIEGAAGSGIVITIFVILVGGLVLTVEASGGVEEDLVVLNVALEKGEEIILAV